MPRIFVYASLRKAGIQKEATGHTEPEQKAYVYGFEEKIVHHHGQDWPTLERRDGHRLQGDILTVSEGYLKKLDRWENHYSRQLVIAEPSGRKAWTYVLDVNKLWK